MSDWVRIAAAQIPVSQSIEFNKKEILKALDWAKDNEVKHLLTPEGALSGYLTLWKEPKRHKELMDALKEVEDHQKKLGINLHLGTMWEEQEIIGAVGRNEIRHYSKEGDLQGATYKTDRATVLEECLGRDPHDMSAPVLVPLRARKHVRHLAGMIGADLCIYADQNYNTIPLHQWYANEKVDCIFYATNGKKYFNDDFQRENFEIWNDAFIRMAAYESMIPIVVADSCVRYDWHPDEEKPIDEFRTSCPTGVCDFTGWKVQAPRTGRQYVYYDFDASKSPGEKAVEYCEKLDDANKTLPDFT